MAINPIGIIDAELANRGLRSTNAAGWRAAGVDAVKDELVRAIFIKIGQAVGQSGITNRAVIFQIICVALAKLGEYPIAGKLIAEIIDDMNLPWLEFIVRAIHGAGVGLHQTLDRNGSNQFDVSEKLMPHLPSDVQGEINLLRGMRSEDIPKLLSAFTSSVQERLLLLDSIAAVDKSDELEADTEGVLRLLIMAARHDPTLLTELDKVVIDDDDREAVDKLREAADVAVNAKGDKAYREAIVDLRTKQRQVLKTFDKFRGFLLLCAVVAQDMGIVGSSFDLVQEIRGKIDDFDTLERRIYAKRQLKKAPALGLAAGKMMIWHFWVLVVGIVFGLGIALYGYQGIFTDVTVEAKEGVEQITAMAWTWHKYWFIFGGAGAGLTILALM